MRRNADLVTQLLSIVQILLILTVTGLRNAFWVRPGYVTSIFFIGGGMFWVGGYLFLFPAANVFNGNTIAYLASYIIPFETFVHIGLFMLASVSYWKCGNLLSFCMTKMGCIYIAIHSIACCLLAAIYSASSVVMHTSYLSIMAIAFSLWFLIPSVIGYFFINREHSTNPQLSFANIKDPTLVIQNANRIVKTDSNQVSIPHSNYGETVAMVNMAERAVLISDKNESSDLDSVISASMEYAIELERINDDKLGGGDSLNFDKLATLPSNITIDEASDDAYDGDSDGSMADSFTYYSNPVQIDRRRWCRIVHILVWCDIIWFAIYILILTFHHSLFLFNTSQDIIGMLHNVRVTMFGRFDIILWTDITTMCRFGDASNLSMSDWFNGFAISFTMAFHRAFVSSCVYNVIFNPVCVNTIAIAMGAILVCTVLNIAYLVGLLSNALLIHNDIPLISFQLIAVETTIGIVILYALYQLWSGAPPYSRLKGVEQLRQRPTILDIALNVNIFSRSQRNGAYLVQLSSFALFVTMICEILAMISYQTFKPDLFSWNIANFLSLWALHVAAYFVYTTVSSAQFADSFKRGSALSSKINIILIGTSLIHSYYIIKQSHLSLIDGLVLFFCGCRAMFAIGIMIGFAAIQSIDKLKIKTIASHLESNVSKVKREDARNMIAVFGSVLTVYLLGCLWQMRWNGDIITLNMVSASMNGNPNCHWQILGGGTPLFGLAFHNGLLLLLFAYDGSNSQRWAPSLDLSRTFLWSVIVVCLWQILNLGIAAYSTAEQLGTFGWVTIGFTLVLVIVSARLLRILYSLDNFFPDQPSLFI